MKKYLFGLSVIVIAVVVAFLFFSQQEVVVFAAAPTVSEFGATISPTSTLKSTTKSYTVTFTNSASSTKDIQSARLTIPSGFSASSIGVGGDASTWNVSTSTTAISVKKTGSSKIVAGHSFTISFSALAPSSTGIYTWTTQAWDGATFGGTEFTITSSQPTVTVQAPPAPTASLSADPATIISGQSSTLTWTSTNATSCTGTGFSTGSAASGTASASPTQTTTYSVSCTGAGGTVNSSTVVTVSAPPPPPQNSSISGKKVKDLNVNGVLDVGEPGISGWTINLYDSGASNLLATTTTDSQGLYSFSTLLAGTYVVSETDQAGWVRTYPASSTYTVTVDGEGSMPGKDFGNAQMTTITGYKWGDRNNNKIWEQGEQNGEPGLSGWTIALGKVNSTVATPIPIEIVALSLTGRDGSYSFSVLLPGNYKIFEENRTDWRNVSPGAVSTSTFSLSYKDGVASTTPLNFNSFFDVFFDAGGRTITNDISSNTLKFGNVRFEDILGMKLISSNDNGSSTPSATALDTVIIEAPAGSGTSTISIPANTTITRVDGSNLDIHALSATTPSSTSLTGLGSGVVVDGALQWGVTDLGLQFSSPVTINIFVGSSFNGQTLNILRSTSSTSGWTNDGIVSPATCLVTNGLCTFSATKASYYVGTHTAVAPSTNSGNGSGGFQSSGGGTGAPASAYLPVSQDSSPAQSGQNNSTQQPEFSQSAQIAQLTNNPVSAGGNLSGQGNNTTQNAPQQNTPTNSQPQGSNRVAFQGNNTQIPQPPLPLTASIANIITLSTGSGVLGAVVVFLVLFGTVYVVHLVTPKKGSDLS